MGTRAYIYQACCATKRHLDKKHRALLSCRELHTAQSSPGQRLTAGRLPERACLHFSWTRGEETVARRPGGFQTVTPPAGDSPNDRACAVGLAGFRAPVHYKSHKATPLPAGAYSFDYYRSPPPRFPSVFFLVKGYFLLNHVMGSRSNLNIEALRVLALSPLAGTMPDSVTGVG